MKSWINPERAKNEEGVESRESIKMKKRMNWEKREEVVCVI